MELLTHEATLKLIREAQAGDMEARGELVRCNIALVKSLVRGFLSRGAEYEDLLQIGSIGLLKAIDGDNADFGVRFSTYAVPMISGEIKRYLRDNTMIKVSRSIKEKASIIMSASEQLKKELQREPELSELEKRTGIDREEIVYILDAVREPVSINAPAFADGEGELLDTLHERSDSESAVIDRLYVRELLERLDERERKVILLRFFSDRTQSEIAAEIGVSQVQVSRIITRVMEKLKEE